MRNLVAGLLIFSACVSASGRMYTWLLSQEDADFQEFSNAQGSALSSEVESERPWESFNEWKCFGTVTLDFDCVEYDHGLMVPTLSVETEQEIFHFDVHVEDRLDCNATLKQWRALVAEGREVCVFAAQVPDVEMGLDGSKPQSLWYINRVKGEGGYWAPFDES